MKILITILLLLFPEVVFADASFKRIDDNTYEKTVVVSTNIDVDSQLKEVSDLTNQQSVYQAKIDELQEKIDTINHDLSTVQSIGVVVNNLEVNP